jgi:hypothetical protein
MDKKSSKPPTTVAAGSSITLSWTSATRQVASALEMVRDTYYDRKQNGQRPRDKLSLRAFSDMANTGIEAKARCIKFSQHAGQSK